MTTTGQAMAHLRRLMKNPAAPKPLTSEGYAYFIGPENGPIKIGYSSDPSERLYRLQTAHVERLYLWAEAPGGKLKEREYHQRFASQRAAGEWFTRCPEIEAEITRLAGGVE